jgi:hypothetical protein
MYDEPQITNGSIAKVNSKNKEHENKFGLITWMEPFSGQVWIKFNKDSEAVIVHPEHLDHVGQDLMLEALNFMSAQQALTQKQPSKSFSSLSNTPRPTMQTQRAEENDSSASAASAITRRIMNQHVDLLAKYGPEKVLTAINDKAEDLHDLEEIGSSDVSCWVQDIIKDLDSGRLDPSQKGPSP